MHSPGPLAAARPGPDRLLADGRDRDRGERCVDNRAAGRGDPRVGVGSDRDAGVAAIAVPNRPSSGGPARAGPGRGRGRDGACRGNGRDPRRVARCGVGGGRRAGRRTAIRLHRLRDAVAGGRGAAVTGAQRGEPRGGFHERGRRRRANALPAERDGPGAAAGDAAGWERDETPEEPGRLLQLAAALPAGGPVVDPDEAVFQQPGDMPREIDDACLRAGLRPPGSRAAIVRCIFDSLAAAWSRAGRRRGAPVRRRGVDDPPRRCRRPHRSCSASSPPMRAGGRWWPDPSTRPLPATSWFRRGRVGWCRATLRRSGHWSGRPMSSVASSRRRRRRAVKSS